MQEKCCFYREDSWPIDHNIKERGGKFKSWKSYGTAEDLELGPKLRSYKLEYHAIEQDKLFIEHRFTLT